MLKVVVLEKLLRQSTKQHVTQISIYNKTLLGGTSRGSLPQQSSGLSTDTEGTCNRS